MAKNHGSYSPKINSLTHGGDYNPDQWLDFPEILKEDLRLMKLAKMNSATLNVFGWAALEPEEGKFNFAWLDKVMDDMAKIGATVVLATPSGAKPNWMAEKYPEIRRVDRQGIRQPQQGRHNHCFSSPVYRKKSAEMAERLASRYKKHPALALWHVNNEYNAGECHCEFCHANFRLWLKARYKTLDALNHAWWRNFWGGAYSDWSQIKPLDFEVLALELDWRRFITYNCIQSFKAEADVLRKITPTIPVTTNFMGIYDGLDYWKIAAELDLASWDNYPSWHQGDDLNVAVHTAFTHDLTRCFKGGKPFLMMESSPEGTNWMDVGKFKKPGALMATSMQALAHGSDSVQYFQWRKGQGGFEQFHGAVVDHAGTENTRVFKEVSQVGAALEKLDALVGTGVDAQVGLIFDWENRWAIQISKGPRNRDKNHDEDSRAHYREFWRRGIAVDMLSLNSDVSKYKVLLAPMLYMLPEATAARIRAFVKAGGIFVTTYMSAVTDESGLCHLGGRPGLLRDVLGIWSEEVDALTDIDKQTVKWGKQSYAARHYAEIVHLEGAKSLASFGADFYAGSPALTVNRFGQGEAYYIASRNDAHFLSDFYERLAKKAALRRPLKAVIPEGMEVCERGDEKNRFIFAVNYGAKAQRVSLSGLKAMDALSGKKAPAALTLMPFESVVLRITKGDK